MFVAIGFLVTTIAVFGSYVFRDGHLSAMYQPGELVLIAGAAIGAYLAASNRKSIRLLFSALPRALKSNPYDKAYYMDLMSLLYVLLNTQRREGVRSIEAHIEKPHESALFAQYPKVLRDQPLVEFMADTIRLMNSGTLNPYEMEMLMDEEIGTFRKERTVPVHALRHMADALPAFGIVAAVMGVIKALASVDQPPAVLANLISEAMVGTFLGVLLAYGFVAPLAGAFERTNVGAEKVRECVKITLLASMNGYPPVTAIEFGRKILYSTVRPSFNELDEHVRQTRTTKRNADAKTANRKVA